MKQKILLTGLLATLSICLLAQPPAYKNTSLTPDERAGDLLKRLTLKEKVSLMMDGSAAIPRLGIKEYNWWNEALHGVARAGIATVFPEPIALAATFEPESIKQAFVAVSDEARAKNTRFVQEGSYKRYQGLTMWTPNVNIFRDPRWGRGIETYGEDPYLAARMGVAVVEGLQGPSDSKYDKLHACAKHFAVHSGPEWNRHSFNVESISDRDLYETYLPAFKSLVQEAKVKEVMCAYNRFEGDPCCGSKKLLTHILRDQWGFDGIIVSDCGAIADFYKPNAHATSPDASTASAEAVLAGTDLECGGSYKSLLESVEKGLIKESELDVSVKRLLKARFELGEMDDPKEVSWTQIPYSVVASKEHDKMAYETAAKSMTLLQNKNNILPLQKEGLTLAVIGPNAHDSVMQWGNYNGSPLRTITILDGIRSAIGKGSRIIYEEGCDLVDNTLFKSSFNDCYNATGKGFSAQYWNNLDHSGAPVATANLSTPFQLCTSGAIVFAPDVSLTDFSARYKSTFKPQQTGEAILNFYYCGALRILVDNQEVKTYRSSHGARNASYKLPVQQGKSYDIVIEFKYTMGDAQLNFDLGFKQEVNFAQTLERVKSADVVVFVGGISPSLEGEEMGVNLPGFKGGDRTDIELPSIQRELIAYLHKAGKRIVYVNCSGSAIGLEPETQRCEAILQAWYPGQAGGKAVADVLFGNYNPAGKLPITFYKNVSQLPDFEDYNMEGRTYRYFRDKPLFPFGYGLSYTRFALGNPSLKKLSGPTPTYQLTVPLSNTGQRRGEEVVQVYLKKKDDPQGPVKTLRAFRRISLDAGKSTAVEFTLTKSELEWWNKDNNSMSITPGEYELLIGSDAESAEQTRVNLTI